MQTSVYKWGDPAGVIIPADALAKAGFAPGDSLEVIAENGQIMIACRSPGCTLESLLEEMLAEAAERSEEDNAWLGMPNVGREID